MVLLNFGTRAKNIGHGQLDFCHVKGRLRPPQEVVSAHLKRGPHAETVIVLMTDHETEGSGVENELSGCQKNVLFTGRKKASKNCGQICFWSNDTTDILIDLWSEATMIQFALEKKTKPPIKRQKFKARFK